MVNYTFLLESDDGSQMYIDSKLLDSDPGTPLHLCCPKGSSSKPPRSSSSRSPRNTRLSWASLGRNRFCASSSS